MYLAYQSNCGLFKLHYSCMANEFYFYLPVQMFGSEPGFAGVISHLFAVWMKASYMAMLVNYYSVLICYLQCIFVRI